MTCYQRHLRWLFDELALEADKTGRDLLHRAIIETLGMPDNARCPEVWAAVRERYGVDARTPSAALVADVVGHLPGPSMGSDPR